MRKTFKNRTFFTVGPSQIFPTVSLHIEKAVKNDVLSMNHRGQEFKDLYKSTVDGLRKLLNVPDDYEIVFLSSALEAMERISMAMSHNDSFHILTGFFGKNWMGIAKDLSKSPANFKFFDWEQNLVTLKSLDQIKIPKESELVCITQNDTSVGFSIPMEEIYKLRQKYPKKLFALDVVSSVPYVDIEYKYLDAVFFSVQKGFGLPPGLSVLILSPKAIKQAQKKSQMKGYSIGSYHSLLKLVENSSKYQTTETPNVLGIYLLDAVVKDFLKIGISKLHSRLNRQAHMLYSFFSKPEYYSAFIEEEKYQSKTTPVFEINGGSDRIRKFAAEKGLILGAGYKDFKNRHIRIGNFPALTEKDFKNLTKVLSGFKS